MKFIGAHVSTSGGVAQAPLNAKNIDARAFALFTKNQRQWQAKPLSEKDIADFRKNCTDNGYTPQQILPHDSYLINLGHPEQAGLEKSRLAFIDEMQRCQQLGLQLLNSHPGSHLGKIKEDECLTRIAVSINLALESTQGVTAVIENTAGQGNNVGFVFEHIAQIIDQVTDKTRVGVCLDTAHTFESGYDLRTRETYEKSMEKFEATIGFKYLKGVHLNDSKTDLASRVDRHESLGRGKIGWDAFRFIVNDDRFEEIPMILETKDSTIWPQEIESLYDHMLEGT